MPQDHKGTRCFPQPTSQTSSVLRATKALLGAYLLHEHSENTSMHVGLTQANAQALARMALTVLSSQAPMCVPSPQATVRHKSLRCAPEGHTQITHTSITHTHTCCRQVHAQMFTHGELGTFRSLHETTNRKGEQQLARRCDPQPHL